MLGVRERGTGAKRAEERSRSRKEGGGEKIENLTLTPHPDTSSNQFGIKSTTGSRTTRIGAWLVPLGDTAKHHRAGL